MFKNMKIGRRLGAGFGVIIAMSVLMSVFSVVRVQSVVATFDKIITDRFPATATANNITDSMNVTARAIRNMALLEDKREIEKEDERIAESSKKIAEDIDKLENAMTSGKGKELHKAMVEARTDYLPVLNEARKVALAGDRKGTIDILLNKLRPLQNKYFESVEAVIQYQSALVEEQGKASMNAFNNMKILMMVFTAITVLLGIAVAFWIVKSITRPVLACIAAADKIAAGDMDVNLDDTGKDETGLLMASMKKMVGSINALIADTNALSKAAVEGKLATRADAGKHQGDFRKIVAGVNTTLDSLVGLIDSMPIPALVIDNSFGIQYINKTGADILGRSQTQLIGEKCYSQFKTSDCNTDKCACGRAMRQGSGINKRD